MTVAELYDRATSMLGTDIAQAAELAREAHRISRTPVEHGLAIRADANIAYASARYEEALALYEDALRRFEAAGDPLEAARTRNNGLQTLIYLSRYDQALEWASRARSWYEASGDTLRLARLDGNVANLLYRQDRFAEALPLYQLAESEFRAGGQPRDVAAVLRNKAVCELSLSRYDDALATHEEARAFCERHGLAVLAAEADYNIAYLYFLRGDYLRARDLYLAARERAHAAGDPYHAALCDLDRAEVYLELNLCAEGAELATAAFRSFRSLKLGYEQAKALAFRGIAAGQAGDFEQSMLLLRRARRRFQAEGNAVWPPLIDLHLATVLEKTGKPGQARLRCERALGFFSRTVLPGKAVLARLLLARLELRARRLRAARTHALAAHRLLAFAPSPALAFHTYFTMGQTYESAGDAVRAEWKYSRAQEELEQMRDRLGVQTLQINFAKDKVAVYESLFRLQMAQGDTEAAFLTAERARARSLAAGMDPTGARGMPEPARQWRAELNSLYRRLESADTALSEPVLATIRERVTWLESELRRQLSEAPAEWRPEALLLGAGEIRALLPEGACLLEYFLANDVVYCFVIARRVFQVVPVASAPRVVSLIRLLQLQLSRFQSACTQPGLPAPANADVERHLRALYRELIAPVRPFVSARHLLIAPHGPLHVLPFHALLSERDWLGREFTVSYTPGANVFVNSSRRSSRGGDLSAVFGIPDAATPHIAREVDDVAAALPGALVFLGPEATEARLREVGPQCRYLHIATHGRFRSDNPLFSSIRLGDGYLSLYDLQGLRLPAELVVLSGCSTGLGVVVGTDEVVGLVRGLLSAGVQSAVVSLWDTRDESTALFMGTLYRQLREGKEKASALQAAQDVVRDAYPHPFDWAPFILVGKSHH